MTVLSILIKNGTYNDFMTLALVTSGAIVSDFEVRIFAMNDAVWALKKEIDSTDLEVRSTFPKFSETLSNSMQEGKVVP